MRKYNINPHFNYAEIFRHNEFTSCKQGCISIVLNRKYRVQCLDAVKGARIHACINASLDCLKEHRIDKIDLMFNNIKISIEKDMDIDKTIADYLKKFDEYMKSFEEVNYVTL